MRALVRITESLGNQGTLDEYLARLGRDHRKYGVRVEADNLARAFREVLRRPATFRLVSRPGHQARLAVATATRSPYLLKDVRTGSKTVRRSRQRRL